MNRTQAQIALIKVSVATCAVLFVFLSVSILDERPSNSPSVGLSVPEVVDMVHRVPASLPKLLGEEKNILRERPSFQLWQPPCLESGSTLRRVTTGSRWIRMATHTCDNSLQITDSKLLNLSNGYLATVFLTDRSKLTSDFIPLNAGENRFEMQLTLNSGETYKYSWTVDRTAITASN